MLEVVRPVLRGPFLIHITLSLFSTMTETLRELAEKRRQEEEAGIQPSASSAADRRWLDSLMKSDTDKMKDELKILSNPSSTLSEREGALEELQYHTEIIDNANDLIGLGGIPILIGGLKDSSPSIQIISAWVLGTCAQNNPQFQKEVLKFDPLPHLLPLLQSDNIEVKGKAIFTLSGILRNNVDQAFDAFEQLNGFEIMINSFDKENIPYNRKLAHVLNQLIQCKSSIKEILIESSSIQVILSMLKFDDVDLLEKVLELMSSITAGSYRNTKCYKVDKAVGSLKELQDRLKKNDQLDQSDYHQIYDHITRLLIQLQKA